MTGCWSAARTSARAPSPMNNEPSLPGRVLNWRGPESRAHYLPKTGPTARHRSRAILELTGLGSLQTLRQRNSLENWNLSVFLRLNSFVYDMLSKLVQTRDFLWVVGKFEPTKTFAKLHFSENCSAFVLRRPSRPRQVLNTAKITPHHAVTTAGWQVGRPAGRSEEDEEFLGRRSVHTHTGHSTSTSWMVEALGLPFELGELLVLVNLLILYWSLLIELLLLLVQLVPIAQKLRSIKRRWHAKVGNSSRTEEVHLIVVSLCWWVRFRQLRGSTWGLI